MECELVDFHQRGYKTSRVLRNFSPAEKVIVAFLKVGQPPNSRAVVSRGLTRDLLDFHIADKQKLRQVLRASRMVKVLW